MHCSAILQESVAIDSFFFHYFRKYLRDFCYINLRRPKINKYKPELDRWTALSRSIQKHSHTHIRVRKNFCSFHSVYAAKKQQQPCDHRVQRNYRWLWIFHLVNQSVDDQPSPDLILTRDNFAAYESKVSASDKK